MNDKIIAFYTDQIAFFSKRLKRSEKSLKDYKSLGINDPKDIEYLEEIIKCEKENVEKYEQKLFSLGE